MFKQNTLTHGVLIGLILPLISVTVFLYILKGSVIIFNKPGVPYLITVALNLFIIRYFARKGLDKIATGMVIVTFLFLVAIFVFKLQPIK